MSQKSSVPQAVSFVSQALKRDMSEHKFKVGELVNYLSRGGSLGVYQITQLLPSEGEAFQYRIKNANEPHERTVKEHELRSAA